MFPPVFLFLHHVLLGCAGSYKKLTFLGLGLSAVAMVLGFPVLVIAHRMRTVQAADKIVVLSEGRVAEEGSPASILSSLYFRSKMREPPRITTARKAIRQTRAPASARQNSPRSSFFRPEAFRRAALRCSLRSARACLRFLTASARAALRVWAASVRFCFRCGASFRFY